MTTQKLRVWWVPNFLMNPFTVDVSSVAEGAKIMDILANYDSFLRDNRLNGDYCNVGGLSILDDNGEWVDWYDEETDIDDPHEYVEMMQDLSNV